MSLRFEDNHLFCGLNNGTVQIWDIESNKKLREFTAHLKGVKCIDVAQAVLATGSYDCTAKIWRRNTWELLRTITMHGDSVWDLKIHADVMATAGLDGTVGVFDLVDAAEEEEDISLRFLIQAYFYGKSCDSSDIDVF